MRAPKLSRLKGTRVLFINWRCLWHPQAGGAERYVWETATRFAQAGASVTLFAARPPGLPARETRDGVEVRRAGGTFSVYLRAALFLLRHGRGFGTVIDCQNGIPFFAPLFLARRSRVIALIHHVHQDQFRTQFRWPLSAIGRVLESHVARLVYGHCPVVVVSPSTRLQVRRRLRLRGPIFIIPNGRSVDAANAPAERSATPRVVYVGRLVTHKRLERLITASVQLRKFWPGLIVDIAGSGPAQAQLERLARRLGVADVVRFHGHVSNAERLRILGSAWLVVNPSQGEGWGLTVIEANAAGRPCLAYRVPGLVDSIVDGANGWLLDDGSDLATGVWSALKAVRDPVAYARWEEACLRWASHFSWDRTARRFAHLIEARLGRRRQEKRDRHVTDAATVVALEASAGLDRLEHTPPSDLWAVNGTTLHVLFQGMDTRTAVLELKRLGLSGKAHVRAAGVADVLLGPAELSAA